MILVLDNYDSFTYNLVQYIGELSGNIHVFRNDKITIKEIVKLQPARIVISPGPCTPQKAGISIDLVRECAPEFPVLGVCLGHQAIGAAYHAEIIRAPVIMHGKTSEIYHDGRGVFQGLSNPFTATRYHSLIVDWASLPDCLEVSAWTDDEIIMGIRHREYSVEGVQFHPESILTIEGKKLLKTFLGTEVREGKILN